MNPMTTGNALTLQFLAWLSERPRSYAETMAAWRTSCPRLSVWEDALEAGLVHVQPGASLDASTVLVTSEGQATLGGRGEQHEQRITDLTCACCYNVDF